MFSANTTQTSGGYQISRSLRFNSADSAYLNRTPASAGNRKTWTFSAWVKRSKLNSGNAILATVNGSAFNYFSFGTSSGDQLQFAYFDGSTDVFNVNTTSTSVYRDVSAWYHIVLYVDTTQATAANRVLIYVNGVQQTISGTYPTQNYDTPINNAISNIIGGGTGSYTGYLSNQYITEVNFIDGQALTPSSFGETNAQTGVWQPKAYSGSYGTNGFYLNFSDNSNTTAATLGKDYSGNGNNWTPNNFSVSAGAGNDSLVDSPTSYGTDTGVGGTVRGNYATWNALTVNKPTLTNGNLDADGSDLKVAISTMGVSTGKWYWEITIGSGTNTPNMGVTAYANDNADPGVYLGVGRSYVSSGGGSGIYKSYTATSTTANSAFSNANTAGATIGFALDCDAGTLAYYVNNVLGYTDSTVATGTLLYPMTTNFNSGASNYRNTSVNFGQRPFAYTAPSGYKALCTQNLPTPTIGATTATQAGKYFNPVIYTGNGSSRSITGLGFQPDFTWIKDRSAGFYHRLADAVRGAGKELYSNDTGAETTNNANGYVTSFDSDGFSLGTGVGVNQNGTTYVAWNWKANGSGSTNTAGSITSTVSANTTSGFSVVTFTGTSANATVGHGLGVAPAMVIMKNRAALDSWQVYHISLTSAAYRLQLNSTAAADSQPTVWNSTAPTSTVFSVGTNVGNYTQVAYCFAEIAGYSKFGSYIGNNSADGPFAYCGFRPAFVMIKSASQSGVNWVIFDTKRSTTNVASGPLFPNTSGAEGNSTPQLDILSNGFKWRNTDANSYPGNVNGDTYIFAAFAESPFKYSLAR